MAEIKHKFDEDIENKVLNQLSDEYSANHQNSKYDLDDFEAEIGMFNNERIEKDYDWQSNIPIPEFSSEELTQIAMDVSQYFQTRDFIETYIQDPSQEALLAADASEELINRTLQLKDLYHYQKFVRAKLMNNIVGYCYAECGWTQKVKEDGFVSKDNFWYDVLDPRNVSMDSRYCYSLQEKREITIRRVRNYEELRADEDAENYFNLDLVKELITGSIRKSSGTTQSDRDTIGHDEPHKNLTSNNLIKEFDVYKRYGLYWIDKNGNPGISNDGEIKENAEFKELIISWISDNGKNILIGFHETPYFDATGNPYRPIIRGLCYIHPTRDRGIGDGHFARPLQTAINDTFNISNDRVMLATLPVLKGKEYLADESDTTYLEPGHFIKTNEPDDLQEIKISDNITGAMQQLGILITKMQQTTSIYPTTMGNIPAESSTTATAVAGASQRSNQRLNYKSLTFEYTFLNELYWMIQQMTWQFAQGVTGYQLMGDKVMNFNPTLDYFYKPLSQSIETEESKQAKIKQWSTLLQTIANSPHPDMPIIFNYIMAQIVVLMGDEFINFSDKFLGSDQPLQTANQGSPQQLSEGQGSSNQYNVPQSNTEMMTRDNVLLQ